MTEVIAYTLSVIKGHCGVTAGESSDLSLGRTANSEIVRLAGSQTLSNAFLKVLRAAQPVSNEGLQIAQSEPREPPHLHDREPPLINPFPNGGFAA